MKPDEIKAYYETFNTEKLKRIASEIFSIKDEYRILLLNELSNRGEIEFVQKTQSNLIFANDEEALIKEFIANGYQSQKLKALQENGYNLRNIEEAKKRRDAVHNKENSSQPANVLEFLPHILFLISSGPILDIFFRLSLFSKDPAPEAIRIFMEIIFFSIYFSSAYLVLKHKYWATWISLSVYSLTTVVCLIIINNYGLALNSLIEIVLRISILTFILSKMPTILSLKRHKNA